MRKNFESKIPKPKAAPSRTGTGAGGSSGGQESIQPKKSNVKFTTVESMLNSTSIGFKIVEQEKILDRLSARDQTKQASRPRLTVSSNNSNLSSCASRKTSKSPSRQKHKILIYDNQPGRFRASRSISPYLCEVSRHSSKEELKRSYQEIHVSDREFKLLKNAASIQPSIERRTPTARFEKTLFGYVAMPNPSMKADASRKRIPGPGRKSSSNTTLMTKSGQDLVRKSKSQGTKDNPQSGQEVNIDMAEEGKYPSGQLVTTRPSATDNFTSVDEDFVGFDSRFEEYRTFLEKMKERVRQARSECNSFPFLHSSPIADSSAVPPEVNTGSAKVDGNVSPSSVKQRTSSQGLQYEDEFSLRSTNYSTSSVLSQWQEISSSHSQESCIASTTDNMRKSVIVAAETSLVLMNTLFQDALKNSQSSSDLFDSPLFQSFINVKTEREALEKAAYIFEDANKAVLRFLQLSFVSSGSMISNQGSELSQDSFLPEKPPVTSMNYEISQIEAKPFVQGTHHIHLSMENNETKDYNEGAVEQRGDISANNCGESQLTHESSNNNNSEQHSATRAGEHDKELQWNQVGGQNKQLRMTVTTAPEPGYLLQTITCHDVEFVLNYVGNTRKVSSLISTSRTKSKSISLTPFQLLDMIDRCCVHLAARLDSSKQSLQRCSQNLGLVVKAYTEGKHGHYSKSLKRSNIKLQGLNTFAGIVLQISCVLVRICEKLILAQNIFQRLVGLLKTARTTSKTRFRDSGDVQSAGRLNGITSKTLNNLVPYESVQEVVKIIEDIENALEIGKNSLTAIFYKTQEVKLKKSLRDNLSNLFDAMLEFDSRENLDFSSILVSAVSSAGMLINCDSGGLPKLDIVLQKSLLVNLTKISTDVSDVSSSCKRMNFVAGYLTSKSLLNLKNNREAAQIIRDKRSQLSTIPWYKRRIFGRVLERTYSMISIPSPATVLNEDDEQEVEVVKIHQANDSSRYSTASAESEGLAMSGIKM